MSPPPSPRCSAPDQPDLGDLAPSAVPAEARRTPPPEDQFPRGGRFGREVELHRADRRFLLDEGMDLDPFAGLEPDHRPRAVPGVDQPQPVTGSGVESGIAHLQGGVLERFRMAPPGERPLEVVRETGERRFQERRILPLAAPGDQVRAAERIAEVVVEAAGPGVGPADDRLDGRKAVPLALELPDLLEAAPEPGRGVQGDADGVEVRPATDADRAVALDTQLHADALIEGLGELEDAG